MEISFCDLRAKEVVNICDGKLLGNIVDLVFDSCSARITGIVVPGERNFFSFFKNNQDIFIPFNKICKIGKDVILVELNPMNNPQIAAQSTTTDSKNNEEQKCKEMKDYRERNENKCYNLDCYKTRII